MRRLLSLLFILPALATVAGCGKQTEVLVQLLVDGATQPSEITVRLHRSTPFGENPVTPPFVVPSLDGADLVLAVTPQGTSTMISLLPPKEGAMDVRVGVTVPAGWAVDPAASVATYFEVGLSKEVPFHISMPPVDMAVPAKDGAAKDAGVVDMTHKG